MTSEHDKLVPTYDEKLVWDRGDDGKGLEVTDVKGFGVSVLNCGENLVILI